MPPEELPATPRKAIEPGSKPHREMWVRGFMSNMKMSRESAEKEYDAQLARHRKRQAERKRG